MIKNCFKNKTVVVTGHTGFKGSWLISWLNQIGANITGVALDPPSEISHFSAIKMGSKIKDLRIDIRNFESLNKAIVEAQPDFVFHLAAQPLIIESYLKPHKTIDVNIGGTLNDSAFHKDFDKDCTKNTIMLNYTFGAVNDYLAKRA